VRGWTGRVRERCIQRLEEDPPMNYNSKKGKEGASQRGEGPIKARRKRCVTLDPDEKLTLFRFLVRGKSTPWRDGPCRQANTKV